MSEAVTTSQLRRMLKAREANDKAQAKAKETEQAKVAAEMEVFDAMEAGGDKSLKRDVGAPWGTITVTPGETNYANVFDQDEFEKWAQEAGFETEMLGERKPRMKVINKYVQRVLKSSSMKMPPGVEHRRTRRITVRLPKK